MVLDHLVLSWDFRSCKHEFQDSTTMERQPKRQMFWTNQKQNFPMEIARLRALALCGIRGLCWQFDSEQLFRWNADWLPTTAHCAKWPDEIACYVHLDFAINRMLRADFLAETLSHPLLLQMFISVNLRWTYLVGIRQWSVDSAGTDQSRRYKSCAKRKWSGKSFQKPIAADAT